MKIIVLACLVSSGVVLGGVGGGESTPQVIQRAIELCRRLIQDSDEETLREQQCYIVGRLQAKAQKEGSSERRNCRDIVKCMQEIIAFLSENHRYADVINPHISILEDVPRRTTGILKVCA